MGLTARAGGRCLFLWRGECPHRASVCCPCPCSPGPGPGPCFASHRLLLGPPSSQVINAAAEGDARPLLQTLEGVKRRVEARSSPTRTPAAP